MITKEEIYSFLPGYFQGLSKVFTTYPFDVMKIKMQKNIYPNLKICLTDLLKNDRKIFFRGIGLPLITFPIDRAISFKIYEDMNKKKINPYISGLISSFISGITNVPMQYLTSNIIHMEKKQYKGILIFLREKYKEKQNIYKGYSIESIRSIFGSTVFLGTYGNLRNILPDEKKYIALSSFCSVSIAWLITFPIDTIRNDYQTTNNKKIIYLIKERYKNFGIFNFYNGISPVLFRSLPSSIIGMYIYEYVKKYLETKH